MRGAFRARHSRSCERVASSKTQDYKIAKTYQSHGIQVSTSPYLASELRDDVDRSLRLEETLMGHVPRRAFRRDVNVSARYVVRDVPHVRMHPTVRLAVHGLRPQSRRYEINGLAHQLAPAMKSAVAYLRVAGITGMCLEFIGLIRKMLLELLRMQHFQFDQRVFLRADAFAGRSIVVHTRLPVLRREDGVPLTKLDLVSGFQVLELPAYEGVVEWIRVSRDERSSPVHLERYRRCISALAVQEVTYEGELLCILLKLILIILREDRWISSLSWRAGGSSSTSARGWQIF